VKVFISYSHKDENYRRALEQRLNVLKAAGRIDTWDDRKVPPGAKWEQKIKKNLDKSQLILFLVSIDFLDSGFVQKVEIPTALKRQDEEGTVLVPIIVRSVDWSNVKQLNSLQALPILRGVEEELVPVDDWPSKDRAWTEVEKGLGRAIDEFLKNETVSSSQPSPAETSSPRTLSPQLPSPRRVGEGLLALTRILKAPDATAIAQQTGETLARARVEARQRIEELGTDKNLHQQLLDLQFKCYNSVSQQSRRNANEVDWEVLDNIGLAFARIVSDLGRIQSGSLLRPADLEWIAELGSAELTFRQSLKDHAIDPLRETARVLSQIISIKLSEINGRLRHADGGLLLQPLSDALAAVKA